jgi:hypothetical protein
MQKIAALCKKHGFECRPDTPHAIQFDCMRHPGTHFHLIGTSEQIYQKFLAVLQAMGWQPLLVAGSARNFKVTYPEDFALAQALLSSQVGSSAAWGEPAQEKTT